METKELIEQLEWWAEECDRTNHGCQARKILQEAADALDKLKKCRHECKIDCLLEEYEKKHDELERVQAGLEWKEKVIELAQRKEREAEAALEREKTMHQHTAEVAWAHEAELEKVKRERDAAIKDWKGFCAKCAWKGKQYLEDGQMDARCKTCRENGKCNWEWRGVKEDGQSNAR